MLTKIHHLGVAVHSVDVALRLYRDTLRLPVTKDAVLQDQGVRGVLLSAGETEVELLEPLRPESAVGRFIAGRGEGLHHLCFATDDVVAELAQARQRGLPLVDEHPRPGLAGMIAFLHPRATRGVLVEYAQPPSGAGSDASSPADAPKFDHVAIATADLDAEAKVFSDNFDIAQLERNDWPELDIRAVRLPIGDGWIGLVTPLSERAAVARFLQSRGEGFYLISIAVADLSSVLSDAARDGFESTEPISAAGSSMAFLRPGSTGGVLIQLLERRA